MDIISRHGQSQGLLYKHRCYWMNNWLSYFSFLKNYINFRDGASSLTKDFVNKCLEILNLKGHWNRHIGSKVTTIFVNWRIFPVGGVASERVCDCSRLVLSKKDNSFNKFFRQRDYIWQYTLWLIITRSNLRIKRPPPTSETFLYI